MAMKMSTSKPSVIQMEENQLKQLVTEVKETLATNVEFLKEREHVFTMADLWNIRRQGRQRTQRRSNL